MAVVVRLVNTVVLLLSLYTLVGCSTQHQDLRAQLKNVSLQELQQESVEPQVSVVTIEEQALNEVLASPTDFVVHEAEAPYAWERVKLFFGEYTSSYEITSNTPDHLVVQNKLSNGDNYRYEVTRVPTKGGYFYQVRCLPNTPKALPTLAKRNGANLARFIREGNLELSLLDK